MLTLKFADGELAYNVDWKSLPRNKVIRYMDYKVGNKTIRLMGYVSYLRLKEYVQGVTASFKGLSKILLVGQKGGMCDLVIIDMINNKISKECVSINEIYNGKPVDERFWRPGQILEEATVSIRNN